MTVSERRGGRKWKHSRQAIIYLKRKEPEFSIQDGKKQAEGDEGKYLADEENIHWIRSNMLSLTDLRGD